MEEFNIKEIWKAHYRGESAAAKYSPEEIQAFKQGQSSRAFRSGRLTILFDLFFKGLFLIILAYLWIISPEGRIFSIGVPMLLTALLIIWEWFFLKKLPIPHSDETLITHLERHLNYLQTTYHRFILSSALTSVLFVYTGFLYHFFLKYSRASLPHPTEDWVIYAFLIAAFGFSFAAQKITHKVQLSDIIDSIQIIEGDTNTDEHLNYLQKKRKRQWMIGILLVILGLLFFIIMLMK